MFVKINYILAIALLFLISACGNSEKTFKDMDSIRRVKDKITGNGLQNWYFIRSYFKSKSVTDHK